MRSSLGLLLSALALAGCDRAESKGQAGSKPGGPGGGGGPPAMPVEVAVARADTVVDAIFATGEIEAIHSIELRPEIEGRVVEIMVREGSAISRGAPLFKVDDAELKAQLARAEAERDLANQALERTKTLLEQNASSAADLERAQAAARSNQAQVDLLRVRLDRAVVRAPFAGVAGERLVSLGDYVTTSSQLVTLQTVNPQRAAFHVPERFAERLRKGQEVTFRVAALPGQEFVGEVDFVNPLVQLPARTILVKARVLNNRRQLQAGMFIEARLATAVRTNAIVVPEDAVVPLQGANFVWLVADGKATRRQVGLGVRSPGFVEVRSGVDAEEQVVVGGQERLSEGAPVNAMVVDRRTQQPRRLEQP